MDSDSDSSFDGFTANDIRLAEQKLAATLSVGILGPEIFLSQIS